MRPITDRLKVAFTGTRAGMTQKQQSTLMSVLRELNPVEFHHGDCVGADAQAHVIARIAQPKVRIITHPGTVALNLRANMHADETREAMPPLVRNRVLVDACDVLVAAPATHAERLRSGTWATVRYARRRGRPLTLILP